MMYLPEGYTTRLGCFGCRPRWMGAPRTVVGCGGSCRPVGGWGCGVGMWGRGVSEEIGVGLDTFRTNWRLETHGRRGATGASQRRTP